MIVRVWDVRGGRRREHRKTRDEEGKTYQKGSARVVDADQLLPDSQVGAALVGATGAVVVCKVRHAEQHADAGKHGNGRLHEEEHAPAHGRQQRAVDDGSERQADSESGVDEPDEQAAAVLVGQLQHRDERQRHDAGAAEADDDAAEQEDVESRRGRGQDSADGKEQRGRRQQARGREHRRQAADERRK